MPPSSQEMPSHGEGVDDNPNHLAQESRDAMASNGGDHTPDGTYVGGQSDNDAAEVDDWKMRRRRTTDSVVLQEYRTELVRAISQRRSYIADQAGPPDVINEFGDDGAALDPENKDFDLSKWLRYFVEQLQEQGHKFKQTGVTFKNLDVYGSGSALQLQWTVASVFMAPFRLGELFSFGRKEPKHILHGFDGILNSGELLVVLGRPGSGCSTLLKVMCGELEGLKLGDKSVIHYDGVPQKQMMREFKGEAVYNQEVRGILECIF